MTRAVVHGASVERQDVERAASLLSQRHPLLRGATSRDGKAVVVTELPPEECQPTVKWMNVGAPDEMAAAADSLEEELSSVTFHGRCPWEVAWVHVPAPDGSGDDGTAGPGGSESCGTLIIVTAHAVTDARCILSLAREFLALVDASVGHRDGAPGEEVDVPLTLEDAGMAVLPDPASYAERMPRQYAMCCLGCLRSLCPVISFGRRAMKPSRQGLTFRNAVLTEEPLSGSPPSHWRHHVSISKDSLVVLHQRCKERGLTIHSLLQAAHTVAFADYLVSEGLKTAEQLTSMPAAATADLRHKEGLWTDMEMAYVAGSLMASVKFDYQRMSTEADGLWELAAAIQPQFRKAVDSGRVWAMGRVMQLLAGPYAQEATFRRLFRNGGTPLLANAGRVPDVVTQHLQVDELYYYLVTTIATISAAVSTYNGECHVVCCGGRRRLEQATVREFADAMMRHVNRVISS